MALRTTIVVVAVGLLISTVSALAESGAPPRYKLEVGQELRYEGTSDFKYEGGGFRGEDASTVWVIRANVDGSRRVVMRSKSKFGQVVNGKEMGGHEDVTLMYFDVFPDGRIVRNDSIGFRGDPSSEFPRLPDGSADRDWKTQADDRTIRYTALPERSSPKEFDFRAESHAPEDAIYLMTNAATIHFDLERGIVSAIDTEQSQGWGFKGSGTGTMTLKGVESKGEAFAKQLASESEVYFKAMAEYNADETKASHDAGQAEAIMKSAADGLRSARARVTLPMLAEALDKSLADQERTVSAVKEEAGELASQIGKPSADWSLKDLDGNTHALADYRGKVVVLDFWYRGCGWCMKAMPQMKQVTDDFKNAPVVIFGMNTDRDDNDAKFVVEKMGLNYATLKATGIPEKYGVHGFPTLIVIDPQGVVRDVHIGYSPHLREDLGQTIRKLLPSGGSKGA
ncbi:MAG TPA: TlpA disulfide reductase family protein [Tepidisphaeraceae bacterium]|jgi:peroxiredoxin